MRLVLLFAACGSILPVTAEAQMAAPQAWSRCAMCHSVVAGKPPVLGPNLAKVNGRKAGSLPEYSYSPAMKASGLIWNKDTLAAFIANPQGMVKGTKMYMAPVSKPADRAAIISYLTARR